MLNLLFCEDIKLVRIINEGDMCIQRMSVVVLTNRIAIGNDSAFTSRVGEVS